MCYPQIAPPRSHIHMKKQESDLLKHKKEKGVAEPQMERKKERCRREDKVANVNSINVENVGKERRIKE